MLDLRTQLTTIFLLISLFSNYQIAALISAFEVTSQGDNFEVRVRTIPLVAGASTATVQAYSHSFHSNTIPRLWLTYIIIYIPSFNNQAASFKNTYTLTTLTSPTNTIAKNLNIPSAFTTNITKNCVIAVSWVVVWTYSSTL